MENFHMVDTQETTITEIFEILQAAKYQHGRSAVLSKSGPRYTHAEVYYPAIILYSMAKRLEQLFQDKNVRIVCNTNTETIYIYPTK